MENLNMRIAVISTMYGSHWGGSEELWAAMVEEALKDGIDVDVSLYRWPTIPSKVMKLENQGASVNFRRLWPSFILRNIFYKVMPKFGSPFYNIFRVNPDVVCISQGAIYEGVFLPDLIRFLHYNNIPYVVICQGGNDNLPSDKISREAAISYLINAEHIAFVSQQAISMTERQLAKKLDNAIVLRNPANLHDLSVVHWPRMKSVHMANVGHLRVVWKGQDILFEALSSPEWRSREWRLRLYGSGTDKNYLEALAHHYGISEKVEFPGYIANVREIWADNHLLVFSSRTEGAPLALVEAMLCGRPSVVTDVGGITEWAEETYTGFIAEAPTAKYFRAALERAWNVQSDWERIGKQAHEVAMTMYDISPGRSLLKIIVDAAGSRKANLPVT